MTIGDWLLDCKSTAKRCARFTCNFALIRYSLWHYALVWICMPVIDGLLFGNSNHPGVHKGSARANHRAAPNPAPAQRSLNRKPAPDANPGGRWAFQMQHIALTRTRPLLTHSLLAQWTFFWARGQWGGAGTAEGCACGSGNNAGNRTEVVANQRPSRQKSPRLIIVSMATRIKKKNCIPL